MCLCLLQAGAPAGRHAAAGSRAPLPSPLAQGAARHTPSSCMQCGTSNSVLEISACGLSARFIRDIHVACTHCMHTMETALKAAC